MDKSHEIVAYEYRNRPTTGIVCIISKKKVKKELEAVKRAKE